MYGVSTMVLNPRPSLRRCLYVIPVLPVHVLRFGMRCWYFRLFGP